MAKVMKTLVLFGDVFGAEKLVPVTHPQGHLVTSFGIGLLKPLFRTMDELIAAGLKAEGGFTVDPRPIDYENVRCNPLNKLVFSKIMYSEQARYEEQLLKVGLRDKDAFSCTCYLAEMGNVPKRAMCFRGRSRLPSCTQTPCSARAATATAVCSTCSVR